MTKLPLNPGWATPAELARLHGVPVGTIYRWADTYPIRKAKYAGRVYLIADDVGRLAKKLGRGA